ncbi:alpha/beta hydrolase [Macrococcus lamae]|uniref:alpha/beta hydrolase n=1 Tax=Macrococcus lamae TaxID=198484 RepID=UPI001FB8310C|nr:alpha/beta fold hydrolase [Macrococcus lamae]
MPAGGLRGNEGRIIADYLKNDFQTHLIDLPGYGESHGITGKIRTIDIADWIKTYLDDSQIYKVNLIGHSLGGSLALIFAYHYPDRVDHLILLDQGHKAFPKIPFAEFGKFALVIPFLNLGVKLAREPILKKLLPLFASPTIEVKDEEIKAFCNRMKIRETEYVKTALKSNAEMTVEGLNLLFTFYNINQPKLINKLKVETLLLYGTFSGINEKEEQRTQKAIKKLKTEISNLTAVPVNGGHYVMWGDDFSLAGIKKFLLHKIKI